MSKLSTKQLGPYDPEYEQGAPGQYSPEQIRQLEQAYGAPSAGTSQGALTQGDPLESAYGAPSAPEPSLSNQEQAAPSGYASSGTSPQEVGESSGLGYDDTDSKNLASRIGLGGGGSGGGWWGGGFAGGFSGGNFNFDPFGAAKANAKKRGRKMVLSGVLGVGAAIAAGFIVVFFVLQAYAQVVHFARVLEKINFATNQLFIAHRAGLLIKYSRTVDTPINRNMGYFGNKFADHFEAKLKAAGIEADYPNRRIKTITIDTNTSEGRRAVQTLREKGLINVATSDGSGKVVIDIDPPGKGNAKFRRHAISAVVDTLELERAPAAMAKRVLNKRAGVNFHPFKNIARDADESLREYYKKRQEERATRIRDGTTETARRASAAGDSESGLSEADQRTAASANDLSNDAASEGSTRSRTEKLKAKLNTGVGVTGYLALVCAIKGLGDESGALRQENVVLPLMRTGTDITASAAQIQAGIDLNTDEVAALDDLLFDEETGTSWSAARSIQAETGHALTGPDMPDSAKPGKDKPEFFKKLDQAVAIVPGGAEFCSGVNSTAGGVALTIAGVALNAAGPVQALLSASSEAAQFLLADLFIDDVISWIAGQQVATDAQGALLGNYSNYGYRLAANETSLSQGGAELSASESVAWKNEVNEATQQELRQSGWYARYFDVNNIDSLAAVTLFENPAITSGFKNVSSVFSIPSSLFSSVASGFIPKSTAQSTYQYGFPQYGFSVDEMDDERFENPYKNAEIIEPQLSDLNEKYGMPCFGTTIDPQTFAVNSGKQGGVRYDEIPDECKDRNNELLVRYRFYIADMTVANCLAQYEGIDEEGCVYGSSLPADDVATGPADGSELDMSSIREDSSAVACAPHTKDVGVHAGYTQGSEVKVRICAVSNITSTSEESHSGHGVTGADGKLVVNSRVSKAFYDMAEAAKADGITLRGASGFRSMEHQTSLCNNNPGCRSGDYTAVARPGTSNHQLGVAVDFYIGNLSTSTSSCIDVGGRCTAKGYAEWEWLEKNAGKFGMKQYINEFWHWGPLEN